MIIFRHVLPNATVATLTFLPFILNGSITTLTSLDFRFACRRLRVIGRIAGPGQGEPTGAVAPPAFAVLAVMLSLLIFIGEAVRDASTRAR